MMSTKSDTLSIFYRNLTNDKRPVEEHIREKKSHILYQRMNGELENLSRLLTESSLINKEQLKSVSYDNLKEAIGEFLINFPVYRFYDNTLPLSREASESIHTIFDEVRERKPSLSPAVHVLEDVLLKKDATQEVASDFYRRCMQFTGPLMAKGVEDTLMYTYNRLIGKNEVGDSPEMTGITSEAFHETMKTRQSNWPLTMNATSTHDTKRGEEVRMRIAVLAELADEWAMIVKEWIKVNAEFKPEGYPDVNDEYFIYQSIVGAYPFEADETFGERLEQYLVKAIREGKTNSDWTTPNEEYERATIQFANRILEKGTPFRRKLKRLQETISDYANDGQRFTRRQRLPKHSHPHQPRNQLEIRQCHGDRLKLTPLSLSRGPRPGHHRRSSRCCRQRSRDWPQPSRHWQFRICPRGDLECFSEPRQLIAHKHRKERLIRAPCRRHDWWDNARVLNLDRHHTRPHTKCAIHNQLLVYSEHEQREPDRAALRQRHRCAHKYFRAAESSADVGQPA
jgi:hypothetical protein